MATANPARAINRMPKLGTLQVGAPGDVTMLEMVEGPVEFVDTRNNKRTGKVYLKPVQTSRRESRSAGPTRRRSAFAESILHGAAPRCLGRPLAASALTRRQAGMAAVPQSFQNSREAIRAPSAIAAIFAHTTSGSTAACPTHVPKPQSLPAITFSRPTSFA